jgi:hypothetical protein
VKHSLSGVLRGAPARALHILCRSACSRAAPRAVVAVSVACVLLAVIPVLGLHVNLSASAPRGLYRTVAGRSTRGGVGGGLGEPAKRDAPTRAGYLGPGPAQPALRPCSSRRSSSPAMSWRSDPRR